MKKILFIVPVIAFLVLLFSHPGDVASGCTRGLTLWYTAVLPSLLPFMIVSNLLVATGMFRYLNPFYAPVLKRIFRISEEGCYAAVVGFLCGFPMGAKVIGDLVQKRQISAAEGSYLLGFCNNVSPAFFLNYICLSKLGCRSVPWKLVLLFYGLPLAYGFFTRPLYHFPGSDSGSFAPAAGREKKQASLHRLDFPMLDACMMDGFSTITRLGGYIMLFTILVQFLKLLPLSPSLLALLSGVLEISCGIDQIASAASFSPAVRTALICTCAAWGGACICAQTKSVLAGTPLSVRTWLRGRITLALLAFLLVQLPAAAPVPYGCW
ncbi:MAG: hypothetical protein K1W28_17500 [Lachnospiraceae bacterium]